MDPELRERIKGIHALLQAMLANDDSKRKFIRESNEFAARADTMYMLEKN